MRTLYDVQQLLKRFGSYVYTGDRIGDLAIMEEELQDLKNSDLIDNKEYLSALMIVRAELSRRKRDERND